jgi:hypothetical protein
VTVDAGTYRALRIETISMGLNHPGTCAGVILRNHARRYMIDNADEIKNGFISGFLAGINKPAKTRRRK